MLKRIVSSFLLALLVNICLTGFMISSANRLESTSYTPRQVTTKLYVSPQNGTANVGQNYTVSIKVDNVTDFYGFAIEFRWGQAVLKYLSHVVTVPVEVYSNGVLHDTVVPLDEDVDEKTGTFKVDFAVLWPAPSFNGSGTIFNMTFQVLRDGECNLYFDTTKLSDKATARAIPHQVDDGYFYRPGAGKVPIAQFDFIPDPAVATKSTVFNAAASYDQDSNGNISLYIWDFGDGILENTTVHVIVHNYTNTGTYTTELSVVDDQGGGSQSKATQTEVKVVLPRPVADFTFWPGQASGNPPGPAALGKIVTFDGSMSYDPDLDGKVEKFNWDFGDGNMTETPNETITHRYLALPQSEADPHYVVKLNVTDSENLTSQDKQRWVYVVGLRDIELTDVTVSSSDFKQGEEVTVGVTVANQGHAVETFNVTAYYNHTATEWTEIARILEDSLNGQNKTMQGETVPIKLELSEDSSPENNVNNALRKITSGLAYPNDDTRVRIGSDSGNWTINPSTINTENSSSTLVLGTPLLTGGWILEEEGGGAKIINGEFSAGQWRFLTRLYATQDNAINATIWVRILKSTNSDPQAEGATVTLIKDWTPLFPDTLLRNVTRTLSGDISMPSITLSNEYLYVEFQLEITQNLASSPTTEVIFQLSGDIDKRGQIWPTTFTQHKKYNLYWDTGNVHPGNYVILVNASKIPHEVNTANNDATSGLVNVDVEIVPLEVIIDVGTIHFSGEIAEFYVLTSRSGRRSNASIEATLFFDGMQLKDFAPEDIISVSKGIYLIRYTIPTNATSGTYALVVDASLTVAGTTDTLVGTGLKSFHISQTLDGWNAKLTKMEGDIGTINTSIGEIKVNLTEIQATLVGVQGTVATISSMIGTFETELATIGGVVAVSEDIAEVKSSLGNLTTSLGEVQSTTTLGIAAAVILAAIAAIAAIITLLRKK